MLIGFFFNITSFVTVIYLSVKLQDFTFTKTKNKKHVLLISAITHGCLALLSTSLPFRYNNWFFDLIETPIYFVSYTLGWKYSLISIAFPIIFEWHLGGVIAWKAVLLGILLPYLLGSFLHKTNNTKKDIDTINIKKMIIPFCGLMIFNAIIGKFIFKLSTILAIEIYSAILIFSTVALIIMTLVINDLIEKSKYKKISTTMEEAYTKLVELSPDSIIIHVDNEIAYANTSAAKLFQAKDSYDLIGKNIYDFVDKEQIKTHRNKVTSIKSNKSIPPTEIKGMTLKGEMVEVEVTSSQLNYNGRTAFLAIIRNITERKESERKLKQLLEENRQLLENTVEYDKLKTEFFANISHELKTPLNIILGGIQLFEAVHKPIRDCPEYKKTNKTMKMIRQNCYRLLKLMNNLIDITKFDSGFMNIEYKNYNIVSIIEDITLSVSEHAENNGLNIIFDTDTEEKIIAVDIEKIERVVLNLLSNAIKFSEDNGNIMVNVYDERDYVIITVEDDGRGIPSDMLDKVFDRFRQVDSLLTRKKEGSGIGLSLVKTIVESHGGKISVESEYGKGAKFIIKLPAKLVDDKVHINSEENKVEGNNKKVERINIEFSDIYS
ncbi:PAS domain-containing sensor histidine kinase [Dethiothermospora halolimnae]|uniref:PAS domain-containing sensor histidine kinase n=1 Tax=Dethiothermospora halolimnae TaxID=3114390 RepID=UPI003CCC1B3E